MIKLHDDSKNTPFSEKQEMEIREANSRMMGKNKTLSPKVNASALMINLVGMTPYLSEQKEIIKELKILMVEIDKGMN